jgi:hypothetical protein
VREHSMQERWTTLEVGASRRKQRVLAVSHSGCELSSMIEKGSGGSQTRPESATPPVGATVSARLACLHTLFQKDEMRKRWMLDAANPLDLRASPTARGREGKMERGAALSVWDALSSASIFIPCWCLSGWERAVVCCPRPLGSDRASDCRTATTPGVRPLTASVPLHACSAPFPRLSSASFTSREPSVLV